MKRVLTVLGVLLVILGAVWFFQGIDVLPGSFMTGQTPLGGQRGHRRRRGPRADRRGPASKKEEGPPAGRVTRDVLKSQPQLRCG